jgi:conjugative relaxase-like TrwC/TraI family protein
MPNVGHYLFSTNRNKNRISNNTTSKLDILQPMIRMIQSTSSAHAKAYFSEALAKADYYLADQELNGRLEGKLAEKLGIQGLATKENFFDLCENINPKTKQQLTPRTKEERTTGYDINFHCPKSVSVLHALSKDNHLMDVFQKSVQETMQDIERDSKTRVRKEGKYDDRETGELVWADFVHQTARPTEDHAPDPHLHSHCFVFNVTWDETEKQFKAGQFRDIKRDMPYYQARFQKRLADKLVDIGYQVRRTEKSFEVEGVPQRVIDLFSKRTDEIGRVAKEKGITDAKEKSELGARTRAKKQKGLTMDDLRSDWKEQIKALGENESEGERAIRFAPQKAKSKLDVKETVDHALKHSFERVSVMADRRILESAYRFSLGDSHLSVEQIEKELNADSRVIRVQEKSRMMCTTKDILSEEKRMVGLAREGMDKMVPLFKTAPKHDLQGQQAEAVNHVLTTSHRVSIIRGAAGTGKTTLMKEAVAQMNKAGKAVLVVAPTSQASRGVLKEEGFESAETVTKLLTDPQLQEKLKGQVLWVDEAGMLGTKDMTELLALTKKQNARLILGGDTRQHSSVLRGDALRILNTVAGIRSAEVSRIYRQKNVQYRSAVQDLSHGKIRDAFETLDSIGSIKTIDPEKPNEALVQDYVASLKKGKSALVISPTNKQAEEVTGEIRNAMRQAELIGKKELNALRLNNLNLTEAQKSDWKSFREGLLIKFNQNLPGIKRGSAWSVTGIEKDRVLLRDESGKSALLPMDRPTAFDSFERLEIGLSKGDKIQITRNGFDMDEKRLNNGQSLEVLSVSKKGEILLQNAQSKAKYRLYKDFGHLNHAHVITSYGSQGKTVDEVFIAQPSATFPATDAKQFYVSVSRGRERARIYTDDKEALLSYAAELRDRESAIELVQRKDNHLEAVKLLQREDVEKQMMPQQAKDITEIVRSPDRDYEPEL